MAAHNELGKRGEQVAKDYLLANGYRIRHSNWRVGHNELDIVAENDEFLVVVEVKSRSGNYYGEPSEFINESKIRRTISAASHYIFAYNIHKETRFDIISIVFSANGTHKLEHISDAFMAR